MNITPKKQSKLSDKLMEDIKDLLNAYFIETGISNIPTIGIVAKADKTVIGIREMVEVVNSLIDRDIYPTGLVTKTRKRELVMKRQIVAYICRKLKYQVEYVGRCLKIDHATVNHCEKLVGSLLKNKDEELTIAYNEVIEVLNTYHKEKYGKDFPEIN